MRQFKVTLRDEQTDRITKEVFTAPTETAAWKQTVKDLKALRLRGTDKSVISIKCELETI